MDKPNPSNSSILQCLLDLEKVIKSSDDTNAPNALMHITALKKELTYTDIQKADEIFNMHKYGDKHLVFSKITRFRENQILTSLSAHACKILMYGIQIMSEDNCFLLNQKTLCKTLHMSKQTITTAVRELIDYNCITKIATLKRKEPSGTIFMIRSDLAKIGTTTNSYFFTKEMTSEMRYDTYENLKACDYDVISGKIPFGNGTITFNYDDIIVHEKK